jgi:hydroxymethylpyrimidine pyrophosphatase-like HAD family hydrolase
MIRLFVLDIDGCLTTPFVTPHWESFSEIRAMNIRAKADSRIPKLALLTGRPQPYAEAMAQMLDIDMPVVFESGGGMFDPVTTRVRFAPAITPAMMARVARIRAWGEALLAERFPQTMLEFAKHTDVGFVDQDPGVIAEIFRLCRERTACEEDLFEVHHTDISVNVILKVCNKGEGLNWISQVTGIPLADTAYIGDSSGDLTALRIAGRAFAPDNATEAVKAVAEVLPATTSEAVLAAYRLLTAP